MGKVSVRYIVADVDAAISFYTDMLGFHVDMRRPVLQACPKGIYNCCSTDLVRAGLDRRCQTAKCLPLAVGTESRSKSRAWQQLSRS